MRIVFMGTPDFSVAALDAVVDAGHEILCVYCQPPRPAGRGQKARPSPVQARAEALDLTVRTPVSLKGAAEQAAFSSLDADIGVVVAYGLILPQPILDAPGHGCINIHASLLPRWRGAAPIQRAILAGDGETGVTIMQMDAGLDTGPMLASEKIGIGAQMTAGGLHDALAELGARLAVETLAAIEAGTATPVDQPEAGVTYAHKIDKAEARIDWTATAHSVDRQVRAFAPWPGAWFELSGQRIKILEAEVVPAAVVEGSGQHTSAPGTVLDDRLTVACGDGAIRILRLQRQGKSPASAEEFLRGFRVAPGDLAA